MENKRLLLVGWSNSINYGTDLQSIALYIVLNKTTECDFFWGRRLCGISLFLQKAFKKVKIYFKHEPFGAQNTDRNENILRCFRDYNLVTINSVKELKNVRKNYSTFVIGSDQVWNPYYLDDTFMLDFLPKGDAYNKISYAASIGVNKIPDKYIKKYKKYLTDFSYISTREKSGADELSRVLNRSIDVVSDPTLLLTPCEWMEFSKDSNLKENIPEKFILGYFVGTDINYWNEVNSICKKLNLPLVILPINSWDYEVNGTTVAGSAGPKEFVKLVEKAEFICTDSFHMCAFSLNFCKQFVAFKRFKQGDSKSQSSRIDELFRRVGLHRYYSDDILNELIDYAPISKILETDRLTCIKKLTEHL